MLMKLSSHTFQSMWFGESLSPYEKMCMKSFIDYGHAFHLYTYSPNLEVPKGVELRNAAEILDRTEHFTRAKGKGAGSHAPFSDVFRYKLLARRGGWWVDADVVCQTEKIHQFDEFFASEGRLVNNAILFFTRGDPFIWNCFHEAASIRDTGRWGDTGPLLITRKLEESGKMMGALPKSTCYPIHYSHVLDLLRPSQACGLAERIRGSLFLHLYNEIFRRSNVSKVMLPPRGSILRAIADRHPVEGWRGEYDGDFLEHTLNTETQLKRFRKENEDLRNPIRTAGRMAARLVREHLDPMRMVRTTGLRRLQATR